MEFRATKYRRISVIFWVLAVVGTLVWASMPIEKPGWDLRVYEAAIGSLRAQHDPYLDGTAIQRAYHAQPVHASDETAPFTYVYSPMTLPLVRLAGMLPLKLVSTLYWLLYGSAVIAAMWVCLTMVQRREALVFALIGPAALFFPGLILNDVIFSGNIAYILHGGALLAAYLGWRRGRWGWFYAAVLVASCFKAPMLYLLAIPVLSAYRQWKPALITAALGVGLFAMQPLVWPATFRHYLDAVELQFSFNRDFSSSPAGVLADALYDVVPYRITSAVFYPFYAALFFVILFYVSRKRFLAGRITLQQWAPLLLVGVLLLNPRVMEYDIAPVTLAMALVCWRFLVHGTSSLRAGFIGMWIFGLLNMAAPREWRATECVVLVCLFAAGVWDLLTTNAGATGEPEQVAGTKNQESLLEIGA